MIIKEKECALVDSTFDNMNSHEQCTVQYIANFNIKDPNKYLSNHYDPKESEIELDIRD